MEPKTYLSQPRIDVTADFIERNKLKIIDQKSILRLFKETDKFLAFDKEVYMDYLAYEMIRVDLTEEAVKKLDSGEERWEVITDINEAVQDFLDYMNFAWGKAEDERGISASRSIQKLGAWLRILDRDDLADIINDDDLYNPYGAPALIAVCDEMGIKVPESLIEFAKHPC